MYQFFYQANFCAECGNALPAPPARGRFGARYFCAVCARQQRQHSPLYRWLLPLAVLLATLGWAFGLPENTPPAAPSTPVVTALNATAQALPVTVLSPTPEPASAFCGARTRRGTPCRRLVQPGQRCAQHRGQPFLMQVKKEP